MNDFMSDFEAFEASQAQRSEQSYDVRMLKRLLSITAAGSYFDDVSIGREAGDEFGFAWFNEMYNPPLFMGTAKIKDASFGQLLSKSLMRKSVGSAFLNMRAEVEEGKPVGVIFPIKNNSNWIIHDCSHAPVPAGVSHIIRKGHNEDVLRIVPFDAFAEGLKQIWTP